MKIKSQKGFTLIELLAVIVILGVILAIAIPSVAKYINNAKKSTYIINVKEYVDAAKKEFNLTGSDYLFPVNPNEATVITFKELENALENGGKKSSYGGEFEEKLSYVVIVNIGTAEVPKYAYYVTALDSKGYGIGTTEGEVKADLIAYDDLNEKNVVQVGKGKGFSISSVSGKFDGGFSITNKYGFDE